MTGSSRYGHMYAPLRIPNFRMFITGQTISTIGTLVQMTAQSWVVYQLTHSPAALGWVTMLGSLPMLLLGPFAGSIADRVPRRTLLIGTQAILGSLAATLAILVQTDVIQIWHIYVLAIITGIVTAIDMPALQAFAADLTGTAMIRQAVTLNSMAFQLARIVGPSLAGLLIGYFGTATAFWVNALSFVAVIVALARVRFTDNAATQLTARPGASTHGAAGSKGGPLEAISYVRSQPMMIDLYLFSMLFVFFVFSTMTVMPAFVAEVLQGDARVLGLLGGISGAGSMTVTLLILPVVHNVRRTGILVSGALIWFGTMLMIMTSIANPSVSEVIRRVGDYLGISEPIVVTAAIFGYLQGMAGPLVMTTSMGLLQQMSPQAMRARLLGLSSMITFGLQPFSGLLVGYSGEHLGPANALWINGFLLVSCTACLLVFRSSVRSEAPRPASPPSSPPLVTSGAAEKHEVPATASVVAGASAS